MTTATSSFNLTRFLRCYKDTLWRNKNNGIIYFILSFIALPLQYIMTLSTMLTRQDVDFSNYLQGVANCYTDSSMVMFTALTLGVSVLIPMQMLSYMHNKRSVDVYHSLPFSRSELLGANISAGLTFIIVPILINFSIVAVISAGQPFGMPMETIIEALYWCVSVLATFSLVVLISTMVGTLFDTFIFSALMDFSWLIFYGIFIFLSEGFLAGFDSQSFLFFDDFYYLSPSLFWLGRLSFNPRYGNLNHLIFCNLAWIVISILFLALAFLVYQRRDSEKAESSTDKGPLSIYARIVGTFGGGLLLGLLFSATLNMYNEEIPLLICIFAGSIITYFIGDIIIAKHVRKFKEAFIPALCYSAVICLVTSAFMFDFFGFEKRIPKIDSIKSVSLTNYSGRFDNQPNYLTTYEDSIYSSPEAIKAVHDYHEEQTAMIAQGDEKNYYYGRNPRIVYTLKSGKTIFRQYRFGNPSNALLDLESCDEFISKNHPLFKLDPAAIIKVTTLNATGSKETELKLSHTEVAALTEALKQDMLNTTPEDLRFSKMMGKINLYIPSEKLTTTEDSQDIKQKYLVKDRAYYESTAPETFITNVIVTDKFKNTLAFIKSVDYEAALDGNLDTVKAAYVGISQYNDDSFVKYVNFFSAPNFGEQIKSRNEYNSFLPLSQSDLEVLKSSLSAYAFCDTPSAVVAFECDAEDEISEGSGADVEVTMEAAPEADVPPRKITGYAYISFDKLNPELQKQLMEKGYETIGSFQMEREGFPSINESSEIPE